MRFSTSQPYFRPSDSGDRNMAITDHRAMRDNYEETHTRGASNGSSKHGDKRWRKSVDTSGHK